VLFLKAVSEWKRGRREWSVGGGGVKRVERWSVWGERMVEG